jgi:hypothetical protein
MPRAIELTDLEPGLKIDQNALDEACAHHPDLFYRVAQRLADETSFRDAAKEQLANTEALVDAEIRDDWRETKSTEKEIDSRKRLDPRVEEARKRYLDYCHSTAQWAALKDAFLQRSYMLKSLGELYISNYYSDTSPKSAPVANVQADRARKLMQEERVRRKR